MVITATTPDQTESLVMSAGGGPLSRGLPRPIAGAVIGFGAASAATQAVLAVRGAIGARALGPSGFGVWQIIRVVLRLAAFAHLGILESLKREVPRARGENDAAHAAAVRHAAARVVLAAAAFAAAGCIVGAALARTRGLADLAASLAVGAVAVAAQLAFELTNANLRADARMLRSGVSALAAAAAGAALAWPLARAFGPAGFVAAVALGSLTGFTVTGTSLRSPALPARPGLMTELVASGIPMQVAQACALLRRVADKLVIVLLAGTTAAGLYGLGDTVAALLETLPVAVAASIAPRAIERFGGSRDPAGLLPSFTVPLEILSRVTPLVVGAAAMALAPVVVAVLPRFEAGVGAAKILALTAIWLGPEKLALNVLLARGRERLAALVSLAVVGVAVAAQTAALVWGLGIEAVAAMALAASAAVALGVLACRSTEGKMRPIVAAYARCALGALLIVAVEIGVAGEILAAMPARAFVLAVLAWPAAQPLLFARRNEDVSNS